MIFDFCEIKVSFMHCCFCSSEDLTHEHIFPRWLSRKFLKTDRERHQRFSLNFSSPTPYDNIAKGKSHKGRIISKKVKCVCKKCNNGWMSSIENEVRNRILNMVNGNIFSLNVDRCSKPRGYQSKIFAGDLTNIETMLKKI